MRVFLFQVLIILSEEPLASILLDSKATVLTNAMASEVSHQNAGVLVPKLDSVVTGTTGKQVNRVEGNWNNSESVISRKVEFSQQSVISTVII